MYPVVGQIVKLSSLTGLFGETVFLLINAHELLFILLDI